MLKKLTLICAAAACWACFAAETAPAVQTLPDKGYVTLSSGDYTVTFMPASNYRISGFAFQGKELFLSRGAASGTNITPSAAEKLVFEHGAETGAQVFVYRFPNVFGKWCKPNYNSVIATFCSNTLRTVR